jgi:hypothetical protein
MENASDKRTQLLLQLEYLIGKECYNQNIQNWGPNGAFYGEGREFRYPVTFIGPDGELIKKRFPDMGLPATVVKTGFTQLARISCRSCGGSRKCSNT